MTGVLESIGNSWQDFRSNLTNHPGQVAGKGIASFLGGPAAGWAAGRYFDNQNQANGTTPDQLRAQAFRDQLNPAIGMGTPYDAQSGAGTDGGTSAGMTPEQMDQHLLAGYTPTSTNTPAWYDNTTTGAADPLGLVPDYSGSGLAPDRAGGNLPADRAGNFTTGSGNQLPGGGYSNLMNGASGQMIADMSASTSGDPAQYVVYHSPTSKNSG